MPGGRSIECLGDMVPPDYEEFPQDWDAQGKLPDTNIKDHHPLHLGNPSLAPASASALLPPPPSRPGVSSGFAPPDNTRSSSTTPLPQPGIFLKASQEFPQGLQRRHIAAQAFTPEHTQTTSISEPDVKREFKLKRKFPDLPLLGMPIRTSEEISRYEKRIVDLVALAEEQDAILQRFVSRTTDYIHLIDRANASQADQITVQLSALLQRSQSSFSEFVIQHPRPEDVIMQHAPPGEAGQHRRTDKFEEWSNKDFHGWHAQDELFFTPGRCYVSI